MRKKSHICLAKYLVNTQDNEMLVNHRKAFLLGSILPDCKPSFVTTKHNVTETFEKVSRDIELCSSNPEKFDELKTTYCRKLGEITHYIADYFTFPHNPTFKGNIKEHCMYEKYLKKSLREYVKGKINYAEFAPEKEIRSANELCRFIMSRHKEYLERERSVEEDCRYIVAMCVIVVSTILKLITEAVTELTLVTA